MFPAASDARMVIEFEPTSKGIAADQFVVPAATPDCPVLVAQVTDVTPTLSLAVPENVMEDAVVEMEVDDGEAIVRVGGVVSVGLFTGGVPPDGGACRVMTTVAETRVALSDATIVMV